MNYSIFGSIRTVLALGVSACCAMSDSCSFLTSIELPRRTADLLTVLDANGDGLVD